MRHVRHWFRPETPREALEIFSAQGPGAAYLGGGTLLAERDDPGLESLVDLERLGLDQIEPLPAGLRVGAMVSLEALRTHADVARLGSGILAEALGSTRIAAWRHQATLGGRVRTMEPGDLVCLALLALDAHAQVLRDPQGVPETLPIEEIASLDASVLLLHVEIPTSAGWRHALESMVQSAQDVPILSLAAGTLILDGRVRAARVTCGGSNLKPQRLHAVEAVLSGSNVNLDRIARCQEALSGESPTQADERASAGYREHLRRVLLGRVLRRVLAATATGI